MKWRAAPVCSASAGGPSRWSCSGDKTNSPGAGGASAASRGSWTGRAGRLKVATETTETARNLNGERRNGGPTISHHPPTSPVFECPSCSFSGCETAVLSHGVRAHNFSWKWDVPSPAPEPRNGSCRELFNGDLYGFYRARLHGKGGDWKPFVPSWARKRFREEITRKVALSLDPQRMVRLEDLAQSHSISKARAVQVLRTLGYRRWGSPGTPWLPGFQTRAHLASLGEPTTPFHDLSLFLPQVTAATV